MDRKQLFKHKSATAKSLREKRRQDRHEQRKKKRDEALRGKRLRKNTIETEEDEFSEEQVIEIVKQLLDSNEEPKDQLRHLKDLRRALSLGTALVDAFLSVDGSLKYLIGVLDNSSGDQQVEAAWCLNNISAGTDSQARAVIEVAGDSLVSALSSGNIPLEDQVAWVIGNLAGGSSECRDMLRACGVIEPLINLLKSPTSTVVHCAAFALSNLARDKDTTNLLTEAGIIPHLASQLVYEKGKLDILAEVCWVLTYLTACGTHEAEVLKAGVLDKIITLVVEIAEKDPGNIQVLTPMLRCLGNIICSGLAETGSEACKKKELLQALNTFLHSDHQHICKECLWVLSNITALPTASQDVLHSELISSILHLMSSTYDIKKEAAYTTCNIAAHGKDFTTELLQNGVFPAVIPLMKSTDVETVHYVLSLIDMILHDTEDGVKTFESCGGLAGLETLEYNNNELLREQADNILDVYFYKEDGELAEAKKDEDDVEGAKVPATETSN